MYNIETLVEQSVREEILYPFIDNSTDGATYVELGVFVGGNLLFIADRAKRQQKNIRIIGIDNWNFKNNGLSIESMRAASIDYNDDFQSVCRNNLDSNGFNFVELITGDTNIVVNEFNDESIDCLFIDALHTSKEYHVNEIKLWIPKVKTGGIITGHDWPSQGIQDAVKEIFANKDIFICSSNGAYKIIK